jgi:hypothetical protein
MQLLPTNIEYYRYVHVACEVILYIHISARFDLVTLDQSKIMARTI